jgi:hypothetical protein
MKLLRQSVVLVLTLCSAPPLLLRAQAPNTPAAPAAAVPDWAWPGSATHQQVPPPAGFHRPTVNFATPIGVFEGQSDIGGPLLPGSARYEADGKAYFLNSASYNIWYFRDEFRYVWKKMSGDVSLAANIVFPNPDGYGDRKAVLVIRQDLDDNAREVMTALHGAGLVHLAFRPEKGADIKEACRFDRPGLPVGPKADSLVPIVRLGLEKHGDSFTLYLGLKDRPLSQMGPPVTLHVDGPFYVGIGFCSHVPDKSDSAVFFDVVLADSAGKVR